MEIVKSSKMFVVKKTAIMLDYIHLYKNTKIIVPRGGVF